MEELTKDWFNLSVPEDKTGNKDVVAYSNSENNTNSERVQGIKVTNYDGQVRVVRFKQLNTEPTYRIYVANPSNYYNGDISKLQVTVKDSENNTTTFTPDLQNGFNDDFDSGIVVDNNTSQPITVTAAYNYTVSGMDYYVPAMYRSWPGSVYKSHVYDVHTKFLNEDLSYTSTFNEVFGPEQSTQTYYCYMSSLLNNSNMGSSMCEPGGYTFIGRSYRTGRQYDSIDIRAEVPSEYNWITVEVDNTAVDSSTIANKTVRRIILKLAENTTSSDRVGYFTWQDANDSTKSGRFNIKQLANASDLKTLNLPANTTNDSQYDILASPRFKAGEDVVIMVRGQRPMNQNQNNYFLQNEITVKDTNGNDVPFDYYAPYKAQEGCASTPYIIKLVVKQPTTNITLGLTPRPYSAVSFSVGCDAGVESPVSTGEILPKACRTDGTFTITPVLYPGFVLDTRSINDSLSKCNVEFTDNNTKIVITPTGGSASLQIYTRGVES